MSQINISNRMNHVLIVAALSIQLLPVHLKAATTNFTYQGQLKQQDVPVSGEFDFLFALWDAMEGGREVARSNELGRVTVKNGLFEVSLDFGLEPFTGETRWIEIIVIDPVTRERVTLRPRQPLTPAPIALFALTGNEGPQGPPGPPGEGVLTLPFSGDVTSNEIGFGVIQNGLAGAGAFAINNPGNTQSALSLLTTGSGPGLISTTSAGPAIWGRTGIGGGHAGYFETSGLDNEQAALAAENKASGSAAHFRTTKSENTNPVLIAESFSDGSAASFTTHDNPNNSNLATTVTGTNESFGMAGHFEINNSSSSATALSGKTNGTGYAISGVTTGTGVAGYFQTNNSGNRKHTLRVISNGRAAAGYFQTNNVLNTEPTIVAETTGDNHAIYADARGTGNAVHGYNAFGGNAVVGRVEGSSGKAGSFEINDASNNQPALESITNGSGPAARFRSSAQNGLAGDFVGDVSVDGQIKADSYQYQTPRTHYLSLTPFDFTPNDGRQAWSRFRGPLGGLDIGAGAQAGGALPGDQNFMCAPVHLPQGATVTNIQAHYYYIYPHFNFRGLEVTLYKRLFWNGSDTAMASMVAPYYEENGVYSMDTATITDPVIDNRQHGFWVYAGLENPCESDNEDFPCIHQPLYGVVITYIMNEAD